MTILRLSANLLAMLLLAGMSRSQAAITNNSENLKHMKNIDDSMNHSADPCEDFYEYACGNGGHLYTYYPENIILQDYPIKHKVNQSFGEKIYIYLKACEGAENVSLLEFLKEVKPGPTREWPFLEEIETYNGDRSIATTQAWATNGTEVIQLLGQLFSYGFNDVFFSNKRFALFPKYLCILGVPKRSNIDKIQLLALLASLKLPQFMAKKYIQEFAETHHYLQSIYDRYPATLGDTNLTYTQLKQDPGILSHLSEFVKTILPLPVNIEEQSFMFHKSYVETLLTLEWQPEEARKLYNYIMFRFLLHLQETVQPGYGIIGSRTKLVLGLNFIYYKHFIMPHKEEYEQALASIMENLNNQFADTVAENRLNLTEKQKKGILTKLGNLQTNIGNIPANITESMVEEYYSTLPDLDVDNFYKTELAVRRHAHLETVLCPKDMFCQASHINAFYRPFSNIITFPNYALTSPRYDLSWHPVFAMSILGFAAGHELVHAIDTADIKMRLFTPSFEGDSIKVPSIKSTVTCLKEQYPTKSVGERLADVVGSQVAFATYKRNFGLQPEFTTIPWQKLYFMSLAQILCDVESSVDYDDGIVRLREIVINSQDFAEAFQCPVGSNMNPAKKCSYI